MTLIGEGNNKNCMTNSSKVAANARSFLSGLWPFLGPGSEEKWYGMHTHKQNGSWNDVAELTMINLRESALLRGTSALFPGALKSKRGGRSSIHYNADPATAELLFRIIISVHQLCSCGAAADWCEEPDQQISDHSSPSTGNLVAKVNNESESKVAPTVVSILTKSPTTFVSETWCSNTKNDSKIFKPVDIRVGKASDDAGFVRKVSLGHFCF